MLINAKVDATKQKLKDIDNKYKERLASGKKSNPVRLAKQQDRAIRKLGKYALKREKGKFAQRHGMLIGNIVGSALPLGSVGAWGGLIAGYHTNQSNFRREGRALMGR